jgi:hypothetical protein
MLTCRAVTARTQTFGSAIVTAASFALLLVTSTTCGSSSTPPAPTPAGYAGQWSGTTSQGRTIAFTVSTAQRVTEISIGYNFNGCSGTNTFPNLNLDIGTAPSQPAGASPGFGFGSGAPDSLNYTQVLGTFNSSTAATGSMAFGVTSCGTSGGIWSATRR